MASAEAPTATDLSELSDSDLFCRYRDLDCQDSFAILYRRYDGLHAFIKRKFHFDDSTADDVVQQAWINLTKSKHTFNPKFRFKSWLVRSMQNCAILCAKNRSQMSSFDDMTTLDEPVEIVDVERSAILSDLMDGVESLLATLPAPMAKAVSLVVSGSHMLPAAKQSGVHVTSLCRTLAELRPFVR